MIRLMMAAALLVSPMIAQAQSNSTVEGAPPIEFRMIRVGEPVSILPDRAYILFRVPQVKGVFVSETVFLREFDRTPGVRSPNLTSVRPGRFYAETATDRYYLIEAEPSSYVIAGQAYTATHYVATCFCMGSMRFVAKAGVVTDLGYILSDDPSRASPFPELRDLTGRGDRIDDGTNAIFVAAIRPAAVDTPVPEGLRSLPREPARFRAVGKFRNTFAHLINRLAPLEGILAYDEDRVIDLQAAPPTP